MSDIEKSLCLKIIRHLRNDGDILSLYSQGFFKRNSFFLLAYSVKFQELSNWQLKVNKPLQLEFKNICFSYKNETKVIQNIRNFLKILSRILY